MNPLQRLVKLASPPISDSTPQLSAECSLLAAGREPELLKLAWARNGFYAFESALHVFPIALRPEYGSLAWWNAEPLWRCSYGELATDSLFFAEDIFGGQFCFSNGTIFRFDPETGSRSSCGSSVNEWADILLQNAENYTGWPLAREWQEQHGPLASGHRLVPKRPFVLGGEYRVANLYALDSVRAMNFYGNIAIQMASLPDGASVRFEIVE